MKPSRFRLAVTADLHWGLRSRGDDATRALVSFLQGEPPDVLLLAGDLGVGTDFAKCLQLFKPLPCLKALVPGNHDIWVEADDSRGDSLQVYRIHLPALCAAHDFHYLDGGPLFIPQAGLALVGSMNWYDYSWSLPALRRFFPGEEGRLRSKRFTRGRHNDANFVRWTLDDPSFTALVVGTLTQHLHQALASEERVIVVTHHPAFYGLNFKRPLMPPHLDALLWDAFSGNRGLEDVLAEHAARIPLVLSGHTHRARQNSLSQIRGYNIGGDYHYKRLLWLNWPDGPVEEHLFGNPSL